MKNKRNFAIAAVCVMALELCACTNGKEGASDRQTQAKEPPIGTQVEGSIGKTSSEHTQKNEAVELTKEELEQELKQYRQEREDNIVEVNGLVEGSSPNEDNYSFDLSKLYYSSHLDAREMTDAFVAARIYVTDTLKIQPNTKMPVYSCIDPGILEIYEDQDKGVAKGYDNSSIFICEYCDENGVWQYLILVREEKGSAWNVIHNGGSYKE